MKRARKKKNENDYFLKWPFIIYGKKQKRIRSFIKNEKTRKARRGVSI